MLINSYSERTERTQQNSERTLTFLFDETWSIAPVFQKILNLGPSATYKTLNRLLKEGAIKKYYVTEAGVHLWGITQSGLAAAWDFGCPVEQRTIFEPNKINPLFIRHHVDLQLARILAEHNGWTQWRPDKLLPKGLRKRPDAVAVSPLNETIAIEYERTIKTKKRYESIWASYLMDIKTGIYSRVIYITPDTKMKRSLERIFSIIEAVPVHGSRVAIEPKHHARFYVCALGEWPMIPC